MAMQPNQAKDESEPESIAKFRGRGWFNLWGVLLLVLVGLLGDCSFCIMRLGFRGALDNSQFGYAAFFGAILGICLIGRWSVPRALLDASAVDRRSVHILRNSRTGWYRRDDFRRHSE
jgi:hypothetical protein